MMSTKPTFYGYHEHFLTYGVYIYLVSQDPMVVVQLFLKLKRVNHVSFSYLQT